MASVSHNIEYFVTLCGTKIARSLSHRAADKFGAFLGTLFYTLVASRRKIAIENLKRGMGDKLSDEKITVVTKEVFRNIGRTLIEFTRFGKIDLKRVGEIIEGHGAGHFIAALDKGKGGLIVTAHFGNWELLGTWFAQLGYPIDYLVGTQHNEKVDHLLMSRRRDMGVGLIPVHKNFRDAIKSLRSNRLCGIVVDQHSGNGVQIDFFGRKALASKGAAMLANKVGCPLLPYLLRRIDCDHHVIIAGNPIYSPNSGDKENDIVWMINEYHRFFEKEIRKYPDQWMWTHRRWKVED